MPTTTEMTTDHLRKHMKIIFSCCSELQCAADHWNFRQLSDFSYL